MTYNKDSFTLGCELEWGDIDKSLIIPRHLGRWDWSETDIVNNLGEFKNVACDPQGQRPKWGGEINTFPSHTVDDQMSIIKELKEYFESKGNTPTASSVSHTHIHIHVPGLKDDILALKKLMLYIKDNQDDAIQFCGKFEDSPEIKKLKAKMYLKQDGGRRTPEYIIDNIVKLANNFDDFILHHSTGKDGISRGRPFRFAINTYSMKHLNTVEFRFFRSSVDLLEIRDCFEFSLDFMFNALNSGKKVTDMINEKTYNLPKFEFIPEAYSGWMNTKWDKSRGKKTRVFHDI
jgi:hypothetical protein